MKTAIIYMNNTVYYIYKITLHRIQLKEEGKLTKRQSNISKFKQEEVK